MLRTQVVPLTQMQSPMHYLMLLLEAIAIIHLMLLILAWLLLMQELRLVAPWLLLVLVLLSQRV